MAAKLKAHALTRLGGEENRRIFYRRDAGCPVIVHAQTPAATDRVGVKGWLVNISEDGCLIASDDFPPKVRDIYLILPGFGQKIFGIARGQGDHTLHIQFPARLTADIVDRVARLKVTPKTEA